MTEPTSPTAPEPPLPRLREVATDPLRFWEPRRWLYNATLALVVIGYAAGCRVGPVDLPAARVWHEYRNEALGVALEIPDYFDVREVGDNTLFRVRGANAVLLRFVDAAEGRQRGLWVGQRPSRPIELGGHAGQLYRYAHGDGPVYSMTDAYVVPYRGKELGLEFRTTHDETVRSRMLKSFHFLEARS